MKKYSLYLFDFDGTLLNTMNALYYVFAEAFKALNIEIKPEDVPELARVRLTKSFPKFGGKPEDFDKFVDRIESALDEMPSISSTQKYEDSDEFFEYVKKNNILIGIVTSNNTNHVNKVLDYMKIDKNLFVTKVGSNTIHKFKPNPAPLLLAIENAGFNERLDEVVYVGDSLNDCLCGTNAGVDSILIDRENTIKTEYTKINNLMELFK